MGKEKEVGQFMNRKLSYLEAISNQGEGKAIYSKLRRGLGRAPGEDPELLGALLIDMPEEFLSKGSEPTREEWACYISMTLYAMHQQGNDPNIKSLNTQENVSLGAAMATYVQQAGDSNAQKRMAVRLQMLNTSKDMKEFSYHLKSIIQLLKTKGIALNYSKLAEDLYLCQNQDRKSGVFLRWGQDFYRTAANTEENKHEKENK